MSETAADRIYKLLHADLLRGRYQPGDALRFAALRATYDCGISPLREALFRLETKKLVVAEGHRGFRVPPISSAEIRDITSLRQTLDTDALRRSIARGDDEWEARCIGALHRLNKATTAAVKDLDDWEARHRAFHNALIDACDSPWLLYMCELLYDQTERYRRLRFTSTVQPKLIRDIAEEHQEILDATLQRDADQAAKLLSEHIEETAAFVLSNLASVDDAA
jgi:GntR family carbon starvation induced transcriptional regulator